MGLLWQWGNRKRNSLEFDALMVWRIPEKHIVDCYFYSVNIAGIIQNNRTKLTYIDLVSARRPPYSENLPILTFHQLLELCENEYYLFDHRSNTNEGNCNYEWMSSIPQRFNQTELHKLPKYHTLQEKLLSYWRPDLRRKKLL